MHVVLTADWDVREKCHWLHSKKKIMSANEQGIIAVTGRAHCQCQVAFLFWYGNDKDLYPYFSVMWLQCGQ